MTDEQLVSMAAAGNRQAFAILYDRHVEGIYRLLASFTGGDSDLNDDLCQETFIRVVDNLDSYRPYRPFARWLYTVALNVGRNFARDNARLIEVTDFDEGDPEMTQHTPVWSLGEELLVRPDYRIAAGLPDPQREVFALRISRNVPYAEIASILETNEETARSRMYLALKSIREKLKVKNYVTGEE